MTPARNRLVSASVLVAIVAAGLASRRSITRPGSMRSAPRAWARSCSATASSGATSRATRRASSWLRVSTWFCVADARLWLDPRYAGSMQLHNVAIAVAFAVAAATPAYGQGRESTPIASPEIEARQRAVLMELFDATDGPHWKHKRHWGSDKPICTWTGVSCGWPDGWLMGHVRELRLPENRLRGTLPASLSSLSMLIRLDLARNELTGEVPPSLLERFDQNRLMLDVSGNGFSNVLSSITIQVEADTGFCHDSDLFLRATLDAKRGRATYESQRCENNPKKDTTAYCLAGDDEVPDLTLLSRAFQRLGFVEPTEHGRSPDDALGVSDHDLVDEVEFTWGDGRKGRATSINGFGTLESRIAFELIRGTVPRYWTRNAKRVDCSRFKWLPHAETW
jgi:hypothetical protein